MKKIFAIGLLFIFVQQLSAQREGNIWFFGQNAGLDFNSGTPASLNSSQMQTGEGCASLADASGNLLFYTDGNNVWTRNHTLMSNGAGLNGHFSATQSAIIVPFPGNSNKYYIFTTPVTTGNNGLCYSVVDLSAAGGLGVVTVKNVLLMSGVAEKLAAVRHANGTDYWVACHQSASNSYVAFAVTPTGVNTTAILSAGKASFVKGDDLGCLTFAADGSRAAAAMFTQSLVEILDFDALTGRFNDPILVKGPQNTYGVSFSPSLDLLYASGANNTSELLQYDLTKATDIDISASRQLIYKLGNYFGTIQLATDGKLYIAANNASRLGVINQPDREGAACDFDINGPALGNNLSRLGLPAIIQTFFYKLKFTFTNTCQFGSTQFKISETSRIDSVKWNFGDPASAEDNFSKLLQPSHNYIKPGIYSVSFKYYYQNRVDSFVSDVKINPLPLVALGADTLICEGEVIHLSADPAAEGRIWQDGSTNDKFQVTKEGTYWVEAFNGDCKVRDSIKVQILKAGATFLGADTALCPGTVLQLTVNAATTNITWQDQTHAKTFNVTTPGAYWVEIENPDCGIFRDTIKIEYLPEIIPYLGPDTTLCMGEVLELKPEAASGTLAYRWSNGSTQPRLKVGTSGKYWLDITSICGRYTDTILVAFADDATAGLGNDTALCQGEVMEVGNFLPQAIYEWEDGATNANKTITQPGTYWRQVITACGIYTDTLLVDYLESPLTELGKDTFICAGEVLALSAVANKHSAYLWNTGHTGSTLLVRTPGTYWLEEMNPCGRYTDTIRVSNEVPPTIHWPADTLLCLHDVLVLDASVSNGNYLWQDGSAKATYLVKEPGTYRVNAANKCGAALAEINVAYEDCHCYMYMPTAFTPGSDLLNDDIKPSVCPAREYLYQVYNRWGEKVFETENIHTGWDGYYRQQLSQEGMYLYTLSIKGKDKEVYYKSGTFYLIR